MMKCSLSMVYTNSQQLAMLISVNRVSIQREKRNGLHGNIRKVIVNVMQICITFVLCKGKSTDKAKEEYVHSVEKLIKKYGVTG